MGGGVPGGEDFELDRFGAFDVVVVEHLDLEGHDAPAARAAATQEAFRILNAVAEREREHDAARGYAMKLIVTPEQYRGITDAGREEPPAPAAADEKPPDAPAP